MIKTNNKRTTKVLVKVLLRSLNHAFMSHLSLSFICWYFMSAMVELSGWSSVIIAHSLVTTSGRYIIKQFKCQDPYFHFTKSWFCLDYFNMHLTDDKTIQMDFHCRSRGHKPKKDEGVPCKKYVQNDVFITNAILVMAWGEAFQINKTSI